MEPFDSDSIDAPTLPYAVYLRYERPRHGYSWRLRRNNKKGRIRDEEIAFRPLHVVSKWRRFYDVCGHIARRALRERSVN